MTAIPNSNVHGMTQDTKADADPRIPVGRTVSDAGAEADLKSESMAPGDLARDTYRQLRRGGLSDTDIMAFAGELLSLVATDVRAEAAAE